MKHFIYIEAGEGGWYTDEYSFQDDNYNFRILGWMSTVGGKTITKQFETQGETEVFYQSLNRKLTNKIEL